MIQLIASLQCRRMVGIDPHLHDFYCYCYCYHCVADEIEDEIIPTTRLDNRYSRISIFTLAASCHYMLC